MNCGLKEKKIMHSFSKTVCVCVYLSNNFFLHAHLLAEVRATGVKFGSCVRTTIIKVSQAFYNHKEEFRGLYVSMGNVEIKSDGRRAMHDPVTMRSLQREVHVYREHNEKIMKS